MEYNDSDITSSLFNSCKQMRDKMIGKGVPYTSQINGANPPQTHRVHMLQNNRAQSTCMPENLLTKDEVYSISWSQARDGVEGCWTVTKM